MPFGLIYGAFYFGVLCPLVGWRLIWVPWAPARALGLVLGLLGLSLAAGLLARRAWARWTGLTFALLLMVPWGFLGGDPILLLTSLVAVGLLAVPATGDVRRGVQTGLRPAGAFGRVAGFAVLALLPALVAVGVWSFAAPPPLRAAADVVLDAAVSWVDFGPGLEKAQSEDKLVVIDFFAEWCGPCHMMDRTTFRDPEVARLLNEDLVAVRIDSEETVERHGYVGMDLAERYDVMTYPTLMLLDGEGNVIARRSGFQNAGQFLSWLEDSREAAAS